MELLFISLIVLPSKRPSAISGGDIKAGDRDQFHLQCNKSATGGCHPFFIALFLPVFFLRANEAFLISGHITQSACVDVWLISCFWKSSCDHPVGHAASVAGSVLRGWPLKMGTRSLLRMIDHCDRGTCGYCGFSLCGVSCRQGKHGGTELQSKTNVFST